jgi:predicted DNA-binding transcriptional regulator YafY
MSQPASRLITLIMLLQRQPNQKAADLAEKLGVSVRTLHRYFSMLDDMGIPVYTERGPHGGFSLVRGYKMPPLVLNLEEATAVYLGTSLVEELWGSLYHEAAQGALAKLDNVLPDEQRQEVAWARRSLVATGMHRSDLEALAPTLEKLRRAVREHRTSTLQYRSGSNPAAESRDVDPYALVHRWGWWYVIAFCHLRQELRSFRVDRIEGLQLTSRMFQMPDDFNVQAYLDQEWTGQPQVRVRMQFEPGAREIALYNRSYWEELEEREDGSVVVTMSAPDLNWAASTALAYGPVVRVLEPLVVQQMVASWAQAVVDQYKDFPDGEVGIKNRKDEG